MFTKTFSNFEIGLYLYTANLLIMATGIRLVVDTPAPITGSLLVVTALVNIYRVLHCILKGK